MFIYYCGVFFSVFVFLNRKNIYFPKISKEHNFILGFFFIEVCCSPTKESLVGSAVSIRLWENNYGPEVQFSLHEKVAMPPTHQIKQGLGQKEQKNEAGDDPVGIAWEGRHEAILEKDFFGCDNDGVCLLWLI